MKNIIKILEERGFIDALTSDELHEITKQPIKIYCGFDPTSDSLHLGNMVAIMGLAWFQRLGHTPVALVGGATGMIGDPSGKSIERQLLDEEAILHNLAGIKKNLEAILDQNTAVKALYLNNYDWFKDFTFIGFLRDFGKYFRIGPMLAKESVKTRMDSEEGMSFTEFTYQVLQGYDFLHLYRQHGVAIQIGGSDQWGNITAGTELIRKVLGKSAYGITFPLLTRSDGQKFGKSEKGAIWLSPNKLSPYEFYQYLIRTADADVIALMRLLTFMEMDEIRAIEKSMQSPEYVANSAQKRLAEDVTRIVHGKNGLEIALKVTKGAAPGTETVLDGTILEELAKDMPSCILDRDEVVDVKLVDLIVKTGLQPSKSEVRRMIRNGGVYMNNLKIEDENAVVPESRLIDGRFVLLALGKKNKVLVRVTDPIPSPEHP